MRELRLALADWRLPVRALAAVLASPGAASSVRWRRLEALLHDATTPEMTVALQDAVFARDVSAALDGLRVPTLVLHRRGDAMVLATTRATWPGASQGRGSSC